MSMQGLLWVVCVIFSLMILGGHIMIIVNPLLQILAVCHLRRFGRADPHPPHILL